MQLPDTTSRGGAKRRHPGFFYCLISVLCILTFAGGFVNGYTIGSSNSQYETTQHILPAATSEIPQTSDTGIGEHDSVYRVTPKLTVSLSGCEMDVYEALEESALDLETESHFTIPSASAVSMERVVEISKMVQNNPGFFWVNAMTWIKWKDNEDGTRAYTINITYTMNKTEMAETAQQLETAAEEILKDADCRDILAASKFVNRWLTKHVEYVTDTTEQFDPAYSSIVGPLLEHKAICSGYAKLYSYLMARLGYESAYCLGYAENGVYHAWNAIHADGDVLYTDSTFNTTAKHREKWLNVTRANLDGRQEEKKYWYIPA